MAAEFLVNTQIFSESKELDGLPYNKGA